MDTSVMQKVLGKCERISTFTITWISFFFLRKTTLKNYKHKNYFTYMYSILKLIYFCPSSSLYDCIEKKKQINY